MLAIYKREVRSYFNSMIGCVFAAFLTIIGGVYFMVYNLYSGYPFFCLLSGGRYFHVIDFCACFIYEIFCRRPKK